MEHEDDLEFAPAATKSLHTCESRAGRPRFVLRKALCFLQLAAMLQMAVCQNKSRAVTPWQPVGGVPGLRWKAVPGQDSASNPTCTIDLLTEKRITNSSLNLVVITALGTGEIPSEYMGQQYSYDADALINAKPPFPGTITHIPIASDCDLIKSLSIPLNTRPAFASDTPVTTFDQNDPNAVVEYMRKYGIWSIRSQKCSVPIAATASSFSAPRSVGGLAEFLYTWQRISFLAIGPDKQYHLSNLCQVKVYKAPGADSSAKCVVYSQPQIRYSQREDNSVVVVNFDRPGIESFSTFGAADWGNLQDRYRGVLTTGLNPPFLINVGWQKPPCKDCFLVPTAISAVTDRRPDSIDEYDCSAIVSIDVTPIEQVLADEQNQCN